MAAHSPDSVEKIIHYGPGDDVKVLDDGTILDRTSTGEQRRISASVAIDPAAERRLVWKFDLRILPTLAVMYFTNALDKGNLGNAKTAGLEDDLHLTGDQYNSESAPKPIPVLPSYGCLYSTTLSRLHQTLGLPDTGLEY